jgi:hypothetical protein
MSTKYTFSCAATADVFKTPHIVAGWVKTADVAGLSK